MLRGFGHNAKTGGLQASHRRRTELRQRPLQPPGAKTIHLVVTLISHKIVHIASNTQQHPFHVTVITSTPRSLPGECIRTPTDIGTFLACVVNSCRIDQVPFSNYTYSPPCSCCRRQLQAPPWPTSAAAAQKMSAGHQQCVFRQLLPPR